ncbi:hypothetical protein TWF696_009134 [Orbilia brochopaga]|uniref:Serine-threonine protein kinase 19-domain-containing protein n=1 Tax=Orbilia brochopaga TaxID=3140254 RepID=A0AAV9UF16_9PEZI
MIHRNTRILPYILYLLSTANLVSSPPPSWPFIVSSMSLNLTAAYRIKKRSPNKNPLNQLHRKPKSSSPRKPATPPSHHHATTSRSSSTGNSWPSDGPVDTPQDVPAAIAFVLARRFTPLPETLVGLGLSRDALADILSFRRALPPVVPLSHLHALLPSRTDTERAIAALTADGTLRRVQLRGGTSTASTMDAVMLTDDFLKAVARSSLDDETKEAFLALLAVNPSLATLTPDMLSRDAIMALLAAGFITINSSVGDDSIAAVDITALTPTTAMSAVVPLPSRDHTHISTLSSLASISHSHSLPSRTSQVSSGSKAISYSITPPNLGLLTHLHASTKSHLLDVLRRCSHREATMSYLCEKWDGGVSKNKHRRGGSSSSSSKKESKFEGRTRKWREFRGVTVEWVVAGLVGAGILEEFHAVGIGRGVRVV